MIPTQAQDVAVCLLDCPAQSSEAVGNEAEQNSLPHIDWPETAIPGWDNLWIDLGGEG